MKELKVLLTSLVLVFSSCHSDENTINPKSILPEDETALICTFDLRENPNNLTLKPNAAIIAWPRWQTGQTVKIKFLDGDATVQEKVKRIADEWTEYANLKFEYVAVNEYADIRIGFNVGSYGAWSVLGMKSVYGNTDEQSMRLGPLTAANEASVRRTVLHEFGHALGLIHENASPVATIKWDLPKVYKYYNELNGWSKEEVDEFVIKSPESTNYTQYDPLSIMHYYVPASLTTDGKGVNEMSELSQTDQISINKWYPFPIRSIIESGERIDAIPWMKSIKSPNGRYSLGFSRGCLYIIDLTNETFIWQVGDSTFSRFSSCYLELNGNITIQGQRSLTGGIKHTTWSSDTSEFPGASLHLQDDGDLQLIYNGAVKWSSKNGKM